MGRGRKPDKWVVTQRSAKSLEDDPFVLSSRFEKATSQTTRQYGAPRTPPPIGGGRGTTDSTLPCTSTSSATSKLVEVFRCKEHHPLMGPHQSVQSPFTSADPKANHLDKFRVFFFGSVNPSPNTRYPAFSSLCEYSTSNFSASS